MFLDVALGKVWPESAKVADYMNVAFPCLKYRNVYPFEKSPQVWEGNVKRATDRGTTSRTQRGCHILWFSLLEMRCDYIKESTLPGVLGLEFKTHNKFLYLSKQAICPSELNEKEVDQRGEVCGLFTVLLSLPVFPGDQGNWGEGEKTCQLWCFCWWGKDHPPPTHHRWLEPSGIVLALLLWERQGTFGLFRPRSSVSWVRHLPWAQN